jgi:ABC-type multidrug transport system ATPase subunit
MAGALLEFNGVAKAYPALLRRRKVLEGFSLSVERGESVGLFGPNGAGKSTILHLAAGFLRPDAGKVLVDGRSPFCREARFAFGFVPENPNFPQGLSLQGLLELQMASLEGQLPAPWRQAEELLAALDLLAVRKRQVSQFSRGMKQKVALVAALLGSPPLLLLDEPISGLDPQAVTVVRKLLQEHRARGGALLISSHLLDETVKVCDRAVFVKGGRIVHEWRATEDRHITLVVLFTPPAPPGVWQKLEGNPWVAALKPDSSTAELVLTGSGGVSPVLVELLESGLHIQGVHQAEPSVEKVFLEVMQ